MQIPRFSSRDWQVNWMKLDEIGSCWNSGHVWTSDLEPKNCPHPALPNPPRLTKQKGGHPDHRMRRCPSEFLQSTTPSYPMGKPMVIFEVHQQKQLMIQCVHAQAEFTVKSFKNLYFNGWIVVEYIFGGPVSSGSTQNRVENTQLQYSLLGDSIPLHWQNTLVAILRISQTKTHTKARPIAIFGD